MQQTGVRIIEAAAQSPVNEEQIAHSFIVVPEVPQPLTIEQAGADLRAGKVSAVELAQESLRRIHEQQPRLNSFITITGDLAIEQARRADGELARGIDRGPLHGIPYGLKDLFHVKGIRTTAGSRIFEHYVPGYDSTVYKKLTEAGAVLMGKTGLHELAYGITSNNPHFGAIRNPHDVNRIPGGSSGGSGAAVVADLVFFAMGTDTGGSIRVPSAYCGCAGLKPTADLVSRYGLMPLSVTLDHAGPMARTAGDVALVMNALVPASMGKPSARDFRVGVPENFFNEGLSAPVAKAYEAVIGRFKTVSVRVPDPAAINAAGRTILFSEASAQLEPHMHNRESIGTDVLALLDQGRHVAAVEYIKARRLRMYYQRAWEAVWEKCDVIFTPTAAIQAPLIGQEIVEGEEVRFASTKFVRPFNVLGLPALSVPLPVAGLPIGLQIISPRGGDASVLSVALSPQLD
jgi:aspartyl-tRNA(Asn)/glutamyl-tRNA(Gln) amidotransferase subunit A